MPNTIFQCLSNLSGCSNATCFGSPEKGSKKGILFFLPHHRFASSPPAGTDQGVKAKAIVRRDPTMNGLYSYPGMKRYFFGAPGINQSIENHQQFLVSPPILCLFKTRSNLFL